MARCSIGHCPAKAGLTGLCDRHYELNDRDNCFVIGCEKMGTQKGMCGNHYHRAMVYGIDSDQLSELLSIKSCEVCGSTGSLHIDHDHNCCPKLPACGNCVRGMICTNCNKALGMVKDDPVILRKMAEYLDSCKVLM